MSTAPLGDEEILAEAKEFAVRLTASLPDRIQISALTFKSKLPFKALAIRELLIHRVSELASSAVENFEIGRVVSGIALTRAVMETGALIFELHRRVTQFLVDKNVEQFDSFLMISLMGSHNNADLPLAMNVLTVIDRMNKTIDGVRSTYDTLCEVTHPNWAGTMGSFGEIDKEKLELKLGSSDRATGFRVGVNALSGALMTFEHYYNALAELTYRLNDHFETL